MFPLFFVFLFPFFWLEDGDGVGMGRMVVY